MQRKSVDEQLLDLERQLRESALANRKNRTISKLQMIINELGDDHPAVQHLQNAIAELGE